MKNSLICPHPKAQQKLRVRGENEEHGSNGELKYLGYGFIINSSVRVGCVLRLSSLASSSVMNFLKHTESLLYYKAIHNRRET
jgi:hypothetical protein